MSEASPFIVVVPARFASSRLPEKALADIHGKPMVVRVVEQALKSQANAVYVATDHLQIAEAVSAHGHQALMTQATHTSGTERLAEVVDLLALAEDAVVVNVQGDEPLIPPMLINAVAARLQQDMNLPVASACHALTSVQEMFNPNVVKVVLNSANHAMYFSRAPIPWARDAWADNTEAMPLHLPVCRHVGIYAYRAGFLRRYRQLASCAIEQFEALEQLRVLWHGYRIGMAMIDAAPEAGVDTAEDLARVRQRFLP